VWSVTRDTRQREKKGKKVAQTNLLGAVLVVEMVLAPLIAPLT
jgi:hypothetical protein